jgi:hypothetical protein
MEAGLLCDGMVNSVVLACYGCQLKLRRLTNLGLGCAALGFCEAEPKH